jgi:hypothetical protein
MGGSACFSLHMQQIAESAKRYCAGLMLLVSVSVSVSKPRQHTVGVFMNVLASVTLPLGWAERRPREW